MRFIKTFAFLFIGCIVLFGCGNQNKINNNGNDKTKMHDEKSVDEENKKAEVYLKPDEVSLAIGKGGYNIKLASMLTGYQIDVYREVEDEDFEDIYLDEFNDEIDQWVIDALKAIGLDTAKAVLNLSKEELAKRVDLEEETIDDVYHILASEFEND